MNKDERIVLERLVQKLGTLRKTLSDEEQALLDQMVTNAEPEVAFHAMVGAADAKVVGATAPKVEEKIVGALDEEVSLHRMDGAVDASLNQEVTPAIDAVLDASLDSALDEEVSLHQMDMAVDINISPAVSSAAQLKIAFDPETENYIINIEQVID